MIDVRLSWDRETHSPDRRTEHVLLVGLTPHAGASQLPANLCIALDCSGSMDKTKLEQAVRACRLAYESLGPNDLFSLITYNSRVQIRLATRLRSELPLHALEQHLASIRTEGLTRTELAMDSAAEILRREDSPGRVTVLILITDGHPTDSDGRNRPASDYPLFYRKTQDLAAAGITTMTVGLGNARHYNSQFLTELADRGQGRFCYALEAEQLAELLRQQIHAARHTIVKELEIAVRARSAGTVLQECCRISPEFRPLELPAVDRAGVWRLSAGTLESMDSSAETIFLARFSVEAVFGMATGSQSVAGVTVSWAAPDGSRPTTDEFLASLNFSAVAQSQPPRNSEVETLRHRWEMILCQDEAVRTTSPLRATQMLTRVVQGAEQLGLPDICEQAQHQIDELRKTGRADADVVTRTRQLLRETRSVPIAPQESPPPSLGFGFGGGAPSPPPKS